VVGYVNYLRRKLSYLTPKNRLLGNVNLISPFFFHRSVDWRQPITEAWKMLYRHYNIRQSNECSRRMSINLHILGNEKATVVKRLAEAIIHFELVLDVYIRGATDYQAHRQPLKRIWRDNPALGGAGKT
jgi:hypothetical protein